MTARNDRRPTLASAGVLLISVLFIAGPTPGDVGGCGETASTITMNEYDYFDRGLCSSMCMRLRDCKVLCRSIRNGPADCVRRETLAETCSAPITANCQDPCDPCYDVSVFQQCVRGAIRTDLFTLGTCPHDCRSYSGQYSLQANEHDIALCGHVVNQMSCNALVAAPGAPGTGLIPNPPAECVGLCQ
jgi:hypothetical protein